MKPSLFSLCFFLLVFTAPAEDVSAAQVTLFSGHNFTGERIVLRAGEQIDDFRYQRFPSGRNANNTVSSIRVEGNVEVTLFEYREFKGANLTLRDSVYNLDRIETDSGEDWGNNLSSVIVRSARLGGDRDHDRTSNDRDRDHYEPGPDEDRGGRHDPSQGDSFHHERRATERMVTRVYRDILQRDPDQHGLETYVGIVEDRNWDEARLRKELKKSPEYKNWVVPRQITESYRAILGREPDPDGLRIYTDRVVHAGWSLTKVRRVLEDSPENQARQNQH